MKVKKPQCASPCFYVRCETVLLTDLLIRTVYSVRLATPREVLHMRTTVFFYSLRLAPQRSGFLKSQSPQQIRQLIIENFPRVISNSKDKYLLIKFLTRKALLLMLKHLEIHLLLALKLHLSLGLLRLLFLEVAHWNLLQQ